MSPIRKTERFSPSDLSHFIRQIDQVPFQENFGSIIEKIEEFERKYNLFVRVLILNWIKNWFFFFERMKTRTPFKRIAQLSNEINDSSLSLSSASFRRRGKRKSILNEAKVSRVSAKWRFLREVRIRCFEDGVIHPWIPGCTYACKRWALLRASNRGELCRGKDFTSGRERGRRRRKKVF